MKPPYEITPEILQLISSISTSIGEINASFLNKQSPQLRKQNKIKTIYSSLKIEGNTLTEAQITAIIEDKKVIGSEKDIREVKNAIEVYEQLLNFDCYSEKSFLKSHQLLMKGLIENPGSYRNQGVGIVKGSKLAHLAPPAIQVKALMRDLFNYIKNTKDLVLIKSCVFHYEMEFIHPFIDGNGRMGRLWQTLILLKEFPVFEFLPFETLIAKTQKEYYRALQLSDRTGKSTTFIEYMLTVIDQALKDLLKYNNRTLKDTDRLEYFLGLGIRHFTRNDYMNIFKDISSATASRDLAKGLMLKLFKKEGELNRTRYLV